MASALFDFEAPSEQDEPEQPELQLAAGGRRNEHAVRVLLIEERPQLVRVVCWALGRAVRGEFDIIQAPLIESVSDLLRDAAFDAILLDLGARSGDQAHEAMDVAETLSHLLPVIVLTGTHFDAPLRCDRDEDLEALVEREQVECDRLPCAILDAIRRHRRVGQGGATPIVYRLHA